MNELNYFSLEYIKVVYIQISLKNNHFSVQVMRPSADLTFPLADADLTAEIYRLLEAANVRKMVKRGILESAFTSIYLLRLSF